MFDYSRLPSRIRRIVSVYEYCISTVQNNDGGGYTIFLKDGYLTNDKKSTVECDDSIEMIYRLKAITKPSSAQIKVALYSSSCKLCGTNIPRGSNYIDLNGLQSCTKCGVL